MSLYAEPSASISTLEGERRIVLRLYIAGGSPRSASAVRNIRRLCDQHLQGCCDLEVVDIYQQPWRATEAQLIAAPTLVRELPLPLRRFIGEMSDVRLFLLGVGLGADAAPER